jgi:hypothetical protein
VCQFRDQITSKRLIRQLYYDAIGAKPKWGGEGAGGASEGLG